MVKVPLLALREKKAWLSDCCTMGIVLFFVLCWQQLALGVSVMGLPILLNILFST
jgi:hypothetical protein